MTAKEKLQHLVDEMSEQEAESTLALVQETKGDPLTRALDNAAIDDERTTPDEDAGADEALVEYQRGETHSADEVKRELG